MAAAQAAQEAQNAAEGEAAGKAEDGGDRLQALEAEVASLKDRWMRSEAEMQNVRNRAAREVSDARQFALQKFAGDIVEVAHSLQLGLAHIPPAHEGEDPAIGKLREGFESTERALLNILKRHGITRIEAEGQPFDPAIHEAMQEVPSDQHAPGHVVQAWTPAWMLNGRLLKPAKVIVANDASTGQPPAPKAD
ncbi:nucleotide exchange factor GrpE [Formicincola oecophyllae]|uniref:Protein GrpE n=1 Tax=Formicincola oecophyllae TaxID=2558361 RepID=A0A4Y6UD35_9PROT|nr:nucleotide exchange factor GrpE [Formicincola oecophyllae]QDH14396.1 nucleotide exchange factor GrpE [Formicincola oecophyllae]